MRCAILPSKSASRALRATSASFDALFLTQYREEMEGPLTMQLHGSIAGVVSYFVMTTLLQQSAPDAMSRSVLLANAVASYMIVFGHALPSF